GRAGGEHLLPFRDLHVRPGAAHHRDDERRPRQTPALGLDLLGLGVGIFGLERRRDRRPGGEPRLALEDDEAPGRELAVIGNARGDGEQGLDLGRGRAGARELDRLDGATGPEQVEGVGHHRLSVVVGRQGRRSMPSASECSSDCGRPRIDERALSRRRVADKPPGFARFWGMFFDVQCRQPRVPPACFCRDFGRTMPPMGIAGTRTGRALGVAPWVLAGAMLAVSTPATAQSFSGFPVMRPPNDVPSVPPGPAPKRAPPGTAAPAQVPKGPTLQSLPPAANPGVAAHAVPTAPSAQGALALSARYGRDLPAIIAGLHWRVYRSDQNGIPRLVKEDKG